MTINNIFLGNPDASIMQWLKRPTYSITVDFDPTKGHVDAPTSARRLDIIELKATPNEGCRFASWSDGNVDNPRKLTMTADVKLTATFEQNLDKILRFTAAGEDSTIALVQNGNPDSISLEYYDGSWHDYEIGTAISIPNGGFIQMRAKDKNATFSKDAYNYYQFSMTGKIAASGSI